MNTCRGPYLEMSPKRFTVPTIALFSASEHTHRALVVCHSQWVSVALHSEFWISTKVVTALCSCYMAGAKWNCCRLGASSVYTIIQPAVICHLHLWQNDRDLLRATAVTRGWNGYLIKSQHRKLTLDWEGNFPAGTPSLYHWAIPASQLKHL